MITPSRKKGDECPLWCSAAQYPDPIGTCQAKTSKKAQIVSVAGTGLYFSWNSSRTALRHSPVDHRHPYPCSHPGSRRRTGGPSRRLDMTVAGLEGNGRLRVAAFDRVGVDAGDRFVELDVLVAAVKPPTRDLVAVACRPFMNDLGPLMRELLVDRLVLSPLRQPERPLGTRVSVRCLARQIQHQPKVASRRDRHRPAPCRFVRTHADRQRPGATR